MYQSKLNIEFDKADLCLYEEVTKMPPFKRRTLAIIGPPGVGRRTLKGRLINSNPDKFAGVIPGDYLLTSLFTVSVVLQFCVDLIIDWEDGESSFTRYRCYR